MRRGATLTGTIINTITVLIGGSLGTLLGHRLPERTRETVMHGLGLVTLVVGITMALKTQNVLLVLGSVLVGGILGEWWAIESKLEGIGKRLEQRFGDTTGDAVSAAQERSTFIQGFVTASLVFCVGPMTILGAIQDGLTGDYQLLAIKSMLDGFASLAFASTLGVGVVFAALTVLVYQGALSLSAGLAQAILTDPMITEMTATGGVLIMGIALVLLDLKRVRVGNFLPAIVIAPLVVAVLQALGIGLSP